MNSMSLRLKSVMRNRPVASSATASRVSKVVVIVVFIVIVILVYTHMDIRITHKYNTVYFCKAKYE